MLEYKNIKNINNIQLKEDTTVLCFVFRSKIVKTCFRKF